MQELVSLTTTTYEGSDVPPADWLNNLPWNGILVLFMAEIAMLAIAAGLVWAIIKVRHEPVPSMLLITLGLLTLVCILGFALTRYQVLGTLAAAGMGAIAGSLTNVLQSPKHIPPDSKKGDTDGRSTEQHPGHDKESPGSGT